MGILKELKRSKEKTKMMKNLIDKINNTPWDDREKVKETFYEYLDYLEKDYILGPILKKYNVDRNILYEYMQRLNAMGGGSNSYYLGVDAFSFAQPLDYLLSSIKEEKSFNEILYYLRRMV